MPPPPPEFVYILDLEFARDHAEEAAGFLGETWGESLSQFERPHGNRVWFQITFADPVEAALAESLVRDALPVAAAQIRRNRPRDWAAFWQHHFVRRRIGRRIELCPDWDRGGDSPEPGLLRLYLNPGLSFGTGDHFTTRFCLEQLERRIDRGGIASMLDLGCGSGILAIAAARLGVPRVVALDYDETAIDHTRRNMELNGVPDIETAVADVLADPLPGPFDLVCANILSGPLIDAAPAIARTASDTLLLSGLREHEADAVAAAYMNQGLDETARDGDGEWAGIVLLNRGLVPRRRSP